jgi:hypothetical protein
MITSQGLAFGSWGIIRTLGVLGPDVGSVRRLGDGSALWLLNMGA